MVTSVSADANSASNELVALSELFDSTAGLRRSRRVVALLRSARTVRAGLRAAFGLQRVPISLPNSAAGREIKQALRTRRAFVPNSLAAGMLELPSEPEMYFSGRRKLAVRTNMRRAKSVGMVCREPAVHEVTGLLDLVLRARGADDAHRRDVLELLRTSQNRFWVVELNGAPVGLAAVTVAHDYAYIAGMLSLPSADTSAARYLLSGFVFECLAREGVRSVLTGSTLVMSPGLIYFQERLGFEPKRVVLT